MRKLMNIIAILILIIAVSIASCVFMIHYMNVKRESESASVREQEEKRFTEEISRLKESERKAHEASEMTEKRHAEEISRLKESEHKAIVERNKAENEAESLRAENESMNDTVKRYKNQLEAMRKENEKLKAEVDRLTKKLNNSLVRIANPFK